MTTKNKFHNVKVTSGDKTTSLDMDLIIYSALSSKSDGDLLEVVQNEDHSVVRLERNERIYYLKTTKELGDILSGEYSMEILD